MKSIKKRIEKKNVLVTGASRGIGRQICLDLLKLNYNVFGVARTFENNEFLPLNANLNEGIFEEIKGDLSNYSDRKNIIKTLKQLPQIDVVIFCAGVANSKNLQTVSEEELEKEMTINYFSHIVLLKELISLLEKADNPQIIAVGSLTGKLPFPGNSNYSASKAALFQFLRSWRLENKYFKKRVKIVIPGYVKTNISSSFRKNNALPQEKTTDVSKAVLIALKSKRFIHFASLSTKLAFYLDRFSMTLGNTLIDLIREKSLTDKNKGKK